MLLILEPTGTLKFTLTAFVRLAGLAVQKLIGTGDYCVVVVQLTSLWLACLALGSLVILQTKLLVLFYLLFALWLCGRFEQVASSSEQARVSG